MPVGCFGPQGGISMHRFFDKQTLRVMRPYLVVVSVCLFLCASVGLYVLRQL